MSGPGRDEVEAAGLCASCEYVQRIDSARGSRFYLCERSRTDPSYPRYPRLPVRACAGYVELKTAEVKNGELKKNGDAVSTTSTSTSTSSSSLTIRTATVEDVPLILSFIRQLAEYERLLDAVKATEEALRATLFGSNPVGEVLIAEEGTTPVGFALFFQNYSTFLAQPGLYLEDLFVIPAARGRGVGRVLLERLAQIALDRGYGRVEWAVLDWNAPAIGFYRRIGAIPMQDWTIMRLTGESLMRLARHGGVTR
jgi:GNAT superfamily N-acetyltransferase